MIFAPLIQSASSLPTDVSALETSISALERAISALESEVKALESSSVPWEYSVWVFTFLVVVGVAMELWVIRHEYRDDMEAWALAHFGVLRSPGRPSITKLRVEVGSVLLITIGVVGELGAGIEITSINGVLRGKSAELRSKNAELRGKSDQLLALVNERASTNEKEAASLKLQAAQLQQQLVKQDLRTHLLDDKTRVSAFTARVKPFKGQTFDIRHAWGSDSEVSFLSLRLMGLVTSAGWQIKAFSSDFGGSVGVALMLDPRAPKSTILAATALQKALFDIGLTSTPNPQFIFSAGRASNAGEILLEPSSIETVVILVGPHP